MERGRGKEGKWGKGRHNKKENKKKIKPHDNVEAKEGEFVMSRDAGEDRGSSLSLGSRFLCTTKSSQRPNALWDKTRSI